MAFLVYSLQDFTGLVVGTFIISFIGNSFVDSCLAVTNSRTSRRTFPFLHEFFPPPMRRRALTVVYFSAILTIVSIVGVLTIPDIAAEGADFVRRLQSDSIWVVLVDKMRTGLGDSILESLEKAIYLATSSDITAATASSSSEWGSERIASLGLAVSSTLKGYTTTAAKITASLLSSAVKITVQAIVSLVLGFMLVWDLPSIKKGVASLSSSRLAPVYHEVAPVLTVFGLLFGKALEVQARIAVVNTILTALGMWFLDIPGIGLLSLFVFVCSFIPIAGCFLSTVPIGFVALTEYGFMRLLLVIFMVFFVHFIEAYFLNPAIYSAHLKLHPLMVLSVLVFAEHSIGVLGLLMAVPATCFFLDYCIRFPSKSLTETAKEELNIINTVTGSVDSLDQDDEDQLTRDPVPKFIRPPNPPPPAVPPPSFK